MGVRVNNSWRRGLLVVGAALVALGGCGGKSDAGKPQSKPVLDLGTGVRVVVEPPDHASTPSASAAPLARR